jgi:hypothetical protein
MILCIDPSASPARIGWAIFDGRALVACGKQSPPSAWLTDIAEAIIERPVIYPHGRTPNPNDIVKLAVAVGELAGVLAASGLSVRYVEPRAWKGTLDKDTCCRRAWGRLRPEERYTAAPFEPPLAPAKVQGGRDHVLDAVGIGLHALGRWRT